MTERNRDCKTMLAGIVWGIDESRILTATVVTSGGSLLDDFHIHVDDERDAFAKLKSFLSSWRIKEISLENLSALQRVKSHIDGPLSVESSAWEKKMAACAKLQSRLKELGVKIKLVNSCVEDYTRCFSCGEPLTRDIHKREHRRTGFTN